jgi:hypothetical protein
MDLSAIIVILVLSALSLAAIIWMEMHSRGRQREAASEQKALPVETRGERRAALKKDTQEA